ILRHRRQLHPRAGPAVRRLHRGRRDRVPVPQWPIQHQNRRRGVAALHGADQDLQDRGREWAGADRDRMTGDASLGGGRLGRNARSAAMKVLCTNGLKSVMLELVPEFERSTGTKCMITWGSANGLLKELEAGAGGDLAILTAGAIDGLIKA